MEEEVTVIISVQCISEESQPNDKKLKFKTYIYIFQIAGKIIFKDQ